MMEQRTGDNVAYHDLLLTSTAYDVDRSAVLSANIIRAPTHGHVFTSRANERTLTYGDCDSPPSTRPDHRTWRPVIPCDVILPRPAHKLRWLSSLLTYQPNLGFYGVEKLKLSVTSTTSENSTGTVRKWRRSSKVVTVIIYVVRNPCRNGGTCSGKSLLMDVSRSLYGY